MNWSVGPPQASEIKPGSTQWLVGATGTSGFPDSIDILDAQCQVLHTVRGLQPGSAGLVTVATLVTAYRANELPYHLRFALQNGVTKDELTELITHLAFYSGWPTANSAIEIARKVFAETAK